MFDIRQSIYDEHGEHDEDRKADYLHDMMNAFAESPEAQPIIEQDGDVGYAGMMMEYYFNYIDGELARMTVPDFNEVVFDLIPRKVSTEPANGPRIIAELRAFWTFVDRQYGIPNARAILVTLNGAEDRLTKKLADQSNWGMAKSFVMNGIAAGYDMTTEESIHEYMAIYNAKLQSRPLPMPTPTRRFDPSRITILPMPSSPLSNEERDKKRKERKRERQARKRARR